VLGAIAGATGSAAFLLLVYVVMLVAGLSALSLGARRLHDSDKSGWLLLGSSRSSAASSCSC
jgi:uncharacterized membrane protein YhaH (DUF805 family)